MGTLTARSRSRNWQRNRVLHRRGNILVLPNGSVGQFRPPFILRRDKLFPNLQRSSATLADVLLHPVKTILEDLRLIPSANNEPLQLLSLLLGVLFPDLQAIDLTPVMIEPPIDLLQILSYYLGSCLHRRDQLLHLQGQGSKLSPIDLRLGAELSKLLISLLRTKVHPPLGLQHIPQLAFKTISLLERC